MAVVLAALAPPVLGAVVVGGTDVDVVVVVVGGGAGAGGAIGEPLRERSHRCWRNSASSSW